MTLHQYFWNKIIELFNDLLLFLNIDKIKLQNLQKIAVWIIVSY